MCKGGLVSPTPLGPKCGVSTVWKVSQHQARGQGAGFLTCLAVASLLPPTPGLASDSQAPGVSRIHSQSTLTPNLGFPQHLCCFFPASLTGSQRQRQAGSLGHGPASLPHSRSASPRPLPCHAGMPEPRGWELAPLTTAAAPWMGGSRQICPEVSGVKVLPAPLQTKPLKRANKGQTGPREASFQAEHASSLRHQGSPVTAQTGPRTLKPVHTANTGPATLHIQARPQSTLRTTERASLLP